MFERGDGLGLRYQVLAVAALLGLAPARCPAQFSGAGGFSNPFANNAQSGMVAPNLMPQGGWAEVLTVTPKWLVLQNQHKQQFPVGFTNIRLFLVRWPTTLDNIKPGSLVEATGIDINSNQLQTDHVDVYEGPAANQLGVLPGMQTIVGYNRVITAFDIDQHNTYGYDYFRLLTPAELSLPRRLHVVGPIVNLNPLQLGIVGLNAVTVLPQSGPIFATTVTPGSASMVRKGDLVYFVPLEATPKSLGLGQLVVYKKVPLDQFPR